MSAGIFEELRKIFSKYGIEKIVSYSILLCWYVAPFLFWLMLERIFDDKIYFIYNFHFGSLKGIHIIYLGLIWFLFFTFFVVYMVLNITFYEEKIKKEVEYATQTFEDPMDHEVEESFRIECKKFVLPYLFSSKMFSLGFITMSQRYFPIVFNTLYEGFANYLVIIVILKNNFLYRLFTLFNTLFPQLTPILLYISKYLGIFTILTFVIGFFNTVSYSLLTEKHTKPKIIPLVLLICNELIFFVSYRFSLAVMKLINYPISVIKSEKILIYSPFIFPATLHLIIQQAAHNIGRKNVRVSYFSYFIKSEEEVSALKKLIWNAKDISLPVKYYSRMVNVKFAFNVISRIEPVLYLGFIDDECAFLGKVYFNTDNQVRMGNFYFDSINFKNEFQHIAENEIEKQRQLREPLPDRLRDIIRSKDEKKEEKK